MIAWNSITIGEYTVPQAKVGFCLEAYAGGEERNFNLDENLPPLPLTSPFRPQAAGNVWLGTTFEVSLQRAARERVAGVD